MAEFLFYLGSYGPFFGDDSNTLSDPDEGVLDGATEGPLVTDGAMTVGSLALLDTDASHKLSLVWNEDDSADRTLNVLVGGGNRSVTVNEDFVIGDGHAGTLTFSAASKVLTVEDSAVVSQDYSADSTTVAFAALSLTGTLTMNGNYITNVHQFRGCDAHNLTIRANNLTTAATERDMIFTTLDATGDAWIEVFRCEANSTTPTLKMAKALNMNSQNITGVGTIACGAITTTGLFTGTQALIENTTLDTTVSYKALYINQTKTAGATTEADDFHGMQVRMIMDDADSTIGQLMGTYSLVRLNAGTIGDGQEDIRAFNSIADVNAGTVNRHIYGLYNYVDIDSAVTSIAGDVYGAYMHLDARKDPVGSVYMIYLHDLNNVDYLIYQSGTAPSHFGGDVDINIHDAASVGLKLGGTLVTASAVEINLSDGSVAGTIVNSKSVIYGASGEVNATTLKIAGNLLNVSTDGTDTTVGGALNVTALAGADPTTHKAVYYNTTTKSLFYDNT